MCNDLGKFHELMLSESDDTMKVGGGIPLTVAGRGIVRLQCLLPEGRHYVIELQDVLFVPALGHCLVSWNALQVAVRFRVIWNTCIYIENRMTISHSHS